MPILMVTPNAGLAAARTPESLLNTGGVERTPLSIVARSHRVEACTLHTGVWLTGSPTLFPGTAGLTHCQFSRGPVGLLPVGSGLNPLVAFD